MIGITSPKKHKGLVAYVNNLDLKTISKFRKQFW